jgi:stage II sporulation protein P
MEGVSYLKSGGLNSVYFKIEKADADPYTQSGMYLKKNLKGTEDYVLIDISRDMTRYGIKYEVGEKYCSPITIKIAMKSKCYDSSLLFAGRVKAAIEEKYKTVPVKIITSDDGQDYNQSLGSMGMFVELGDSANTYGEAREALKIFCQAILQVDSIGR